MNRNLKFSATLIALLTAASMTLAACGKKGDLYLPDAELTQSKSHWALNADPRQLTVAAFNVHAH